MPSWPRGCCATCISSPSNECICVCKINGSFSFILVNNGKDTGTKNSFAIFVTLLSLAFTVLVTVVSLYDTIIVISEMTFCCLLLWCFRLQLPLLEKMMHLLTWKMHPQKIFIWDTQQWRDFCMTSVQNRKLPTIPSAKLIFKNKFSGACLDCYLIKYENDPC